MSNKQAAGPTPAVEEEVSGLPAVGEEPVEEIVALREPEVVDLADEALVDVEQTGGSGVMDLGDDAVMSADTTEGPGIVDLGEGPLSSIWAMTPACPSTRPKAPASWT